MNVNQIKTLQRNLGVKDDGILGPITYAAIYRKLGASVEYARELGVATARDFPKFKMDVDPLIFAHFFSQMAHESGGFRYREEIASGAAYEGRKILGNVHPGDGRRFKGRGIIQLTGRDNYTRYGKKLGINLVDNPQLAADPDASVQIAIQYWNDRNLNTHASADNVRAVTKAINGGYNGLDDRERRLGTMKKLLGLA